MAGRRKWVTDFRRGAHGMVFVIGPRDSMRFTNVPLAASPCAATLVAHDDPQRSIPAKIVQNRRTILIICILPLLLAFNGRWRIGVDSSIYRGLAANLVEGRGYHFGEFGTHQIYPGLPLILAGTTRLFHDSAFRPIGGLLVILCCALLTLWV